MARYFKGHKRPCECPLWGHVNLHVLVVTAERSAWYEQFESKFGLSDFIRSLPFLIEMRLAACSKSYMEWWYVAGRDLHSAPLTCPKCVFNGRGLVAISETGRCPVIAVTRVLICDVCTRFWRYVQDTVGKRRPISFWLMQLRTNVCMG